MEDAPAARGTVRYMLLLRGRAPRARVTVRAFITALPGTVMRHFSLISVNLLSLPSATEKQVAIKWQTETASTKLMGVEPCVFPVRNVHIAAGRGFDEQESRGRRRIVVSSSCASALPAPA